MAKRKHLALRATYALAHLAKAASALGLPGLVGPTASIALDAAQSEITAAPSQDVAELRFQRRADFRCASSCASEAVTKSTDCRVDDYAVSDVRRRLPLCRPFYGGWSTKCSIYTVPDSS